MTKEARRFEPMETLLPEDVTVGSIVLYQSPSDPNKTWPAIVNHIVREGIVNLHVFCDYYPTGPFVSCMRGVKYDLTGQPGTWRWEL